MRRRDHIVCRRREARSEPGGEVGDLDRDRKHAQRKTRRSGTPHSDRIGKSGGPAGHLFRPCRRDALRRNGPRRRSVSAPKASSARCNQCTPAPPEGTFRVGGGVSAPSLIEKFEPRYSVEAKAAKYQGTIALSLVVGEAGSPRDIRVLRGLGMGLDERAVAAVSAWRFKPGMKDGLAVPVFATVEVNFRLL
ncbi:MAG: energy transducer TonB [Acidobacteria bacterium]|nr:energy transducer TonB [Acidobacteriota bacterium]